MTVKSPPSESKPPMFSRICTRVLPLRLIGCVLLIIAASSAPVCAQFIGDEPLDPVEATGELTVLVRVGIYVTILIVAFGLFFLAGYRVLLTRRGLWPSTLYGLCLGLFLATSIVVLWPLFGDYWIRDNRGPLEAYGPQLLIVTGAVTAFVLSMLLFRSAETNKEA